MLEFSEQELQRYARHLVMPEVGVDGQRKLKAARVLCVGAGGLGSPVALYLAAAGIGQLGVVEDDSVEASNLQRQVLYAQQDVGRPKIEAALARLSSLNSDIELVAHAVRLTADNALELLSGYDIVVDGSDNFSTRYVVNDAAVLAGIPNVHASVLRFAGQLTVFDAQRGPCYRCLFPEPPSPEATPSCATGGVLGVMPGILGSLQALEVIKLVLQQGEPLLGRLLMFDGLGGAFRTLAVGKDPACRLCGEAPDITSVQRVTAAGSAGVGEVDLPRISPSALAARLKHRDAPYLIDVRESAELDIVRFAGAISLPLSELPARLGELEIDGQYVITCHHGARSVRAAQLLRERGFNNLAMLEGGIDAWARQIDHSMARY